MRWFLAGFALACVSTGGARVAVECAPVVKPNVDCSLKGHFEQRGLPRECRQS